MLKKNLAQEMCSNSTGTQDVKSMEMNLWLESILMAEKNSPRMEVVRRRSLIEQEFADKHHLEILGDTL